MMANVIRERGLLKAMVFAVVCTLGVSVQADNGNVESPFSSGYKVKIADAKASKSRFARSQIKRYSQLWAKDVEKRFANQPKQLLDQYQQIIESAKGYSSLQVRYTMLAADLAKANELEFDQDLLKVTDKLKPLDRRSPADHKRYDYLTTSKTTGLDR